MSEKITSLLNLINLLTAIDYNCDLDYNELQKIIDWDGKNPLNYNYDDVYINIIMYYIILTYGDFEKSPKFGWITDFEKFNDMKENLKIWCITKEM